MENNLRVINTARSEAAINKAVEDGYWPLVKPVTPSPKIKSKYAVMQNKTTGKIEVIHDYRDGAYNFGRDSEAELQTIIDFTFYYPHHFEAPFAAYLIPSDIVVGESVILSDLIEDIVETEWNQGDTFRLASCEANWNGKDFNILFNTPKTSTIIG